MRVIIESPYAGGHANVRYSRRCLRDSLNRGESPFASHLLYTQKEVLDDKIPADRRKGIDAAVAWLEVADAVAVYMDMHVTPGMVHGIVRASVLNKPIKLRWLDGEQAGKEVVIE
jgi:hypothetical protein